MAKRSSYEPKFEAAGQDYMRTMVEAEAGVDPLGRGHQAPGPTRTSSNPYCETNQRKPYQPVEDISTPGLDEGVAYRQKL